MVILNTIKTSISKKIQQFNAPVQSGPEKSVYLRLPYIGPISTKFEKQIKTAVKACFAALEPRVVYTTKDLVSRKERCTSCLFTKLPIFLLL